MVTAVDVQVLADPTGRLIRASPALPGAATTGGSARRLGIIDALQTTGVRVVVDNGDRGAGIEVPRRRRHADPETARRRRLA